jgi:hypothetical protein
MARAVTLVALALTFAVGAVLMPPLARVSYACSCTRPPPTVQQTFDDADAVFSGRVQVLEQTKIEALFPDPRTQMVAMVEGVHARLDAIESWKGAAGHDIELWTGRGGGDCGYEFQLAEAYLVFARRTPNGRLVTGLCTNTRPLAEAVTELAALGPGTRVQPPLPGEQPFQPWSGLAAVGVLAPVSLGALWLVRGRRSRHH